MFELLEDIQLLKWDVCINKITLVDFRHKDDQHSMTTSTQTHHEVQLNTTYFEGNITQHTLVWIQTGLTSNLKGMSTNEKS